MMHEKPLVPKKRVIKEIDDAIAPAARIQRLEAIYITIEFYQSEALSPRIPKSLPESNLYRHVVIWRISTIDRITSKWFRFLLTLHQLNVEPPQCSSDECHALILGKMSPRAKRDPTAERFHRLD
jgi:hypothetical protein